MSPDLSARSRADLSPDASAESFPEAAYSYHRKPRGASRRKCPICGLNAQRKGYHRLVRPSERLAARYLIRVGNEDQAVMRTGGRLASAFHDRLVMPHGKNAKSPAGRKINRPRRVKPAPAMYASIQDIARLTIAGYTVREVARELGVPRHAIDWPKQRYASEFRKLVDLAMPEAVERVRQEIGTEAVLLDAPDYLRRANVVDRWLAKMSHPKLGWPGGDLTLSRMFERHYRPLCLGDAAALTMEQYEIVLRRWRLVMGDPPLVSITKYTLALFRDFNLRLTLPSGAATSPNTVRRRMQHIQTLLDKCGPPHPRNRDALGLLTDVPWLRRVREMHFEPRVVSDQELSAVYRAAAKMTRPRIEGFDTATWWRALLVMAYNTGLRRRTLFSLELAHIDWKSCCLHAPPQLLKMGRAHWIPLHGVVIEHLEALWPADRRQASAKLFPLPCGDREFSNHFRRLQNAAELTEEQRFGLHDLRRTNATALWSSNPAAAELMLGHAGRGVTAKHYVNSRDILAKAVAQLPQPSSFLA